mgnify:CR=1 FL=1
MMMNDKNKMNSPLVSIIIRTKNEERWVGYCLREVYNQSYTNFEVIIVDNNSTDSTLVKAEQFPLKVINIDKYLPGKALNKGINESRGEFLVFLSGHCIPASNSWLDNLVSNFVNEKVVGVYGRQLPMSFSSSQTKRDLLITFGLDKRVQIKDSFFHNANSAIRRDVWEKTSFDETVTNIEDRIWAGQVLNNGNQIVYEPEAAVYHHHGIHHDNEDIRMSNTINIIEKINNSDMNDYGKIDPEKTKIISIIPHIGDMLLFNNIPLLKTTVDFSLKSKLIEKTIVLTDNEDVADSVKKMGATVPFIRNKEHSEDFIDLSMVYSFYISKLIEKGIVADLVLSLEPQYIFRPKDLIENLINLLLSKGYDSVVPVVKNYGTAWIEKDGSIIRADSGNIPMSVKKPLYLSAKGLGFATHIEYLLSGELIGDNCGIYPIESKYSAIQIKKNEDTMYWKNYLESNIGKAS